MISPALARLHAEAPPTRLGGDHAAPLIALERVTRRYGTGDAAVLALNAVDLRVAAGDFVAIMGPSGSGKSTAMNILGCLDTPSEGRHLFQGADVGSLDRDSRALIRRHFLGFVFQGFNLLKRTSALENVALPLIYRGVGKRARLERAAHALDQVGLADRMDHHPSQLSGGQQQRVAIARALVTEPLCLLADEPTGNLDTARSVEIMELLGALNAKGITILLVTHEEEMAAYARRQVVFRDGIIARDERLRVATLPADLSGGAA